MKNLHQSLLAVVMLLASVFTYAQAPVYSSHPSASATLFLDFDGHLVNGTSWNSNGPIECASANITADQVTEIFNRVAEDYRPFNINVTTDSTKYLAAPPAQRMRVIVTTSSSWYGSAGGVAYIGSFTWGDNTPAFVFSALLGYNTKKIAEATSHEMGHTLGLRHQSSYDNNCVKTAEYNPGTGTGEIAWAPIMGVGYSKNLTLWNNGANPYGCTSFQDDLGMITSFFNGFGYRTDDHQATIAGATFAEMTNNQFTAGGIIETATDKDVFKFILPVAGNLRLDAIPYNTGTGNSGSNLDMQLEILDSESNILNTYNPGDVLSLSIDSTFTAGTYYLRLQGKGNIYAPEYASLGSYSLTSSFRPLVPLPLHRLELRGTNENSNHKLTWTIEADETVTQQVLEVSTNNRNYHPLTSLNTNARAYNNTSSLSSGWLHYRMNVTFDNGRQYYSNIVTLPNNSENVKPVVAGNLVRNSITVNSPSPFFYTVTDYNGRMISKGNLIQGINNINTSSLSRGMYIIQFSNGHEQYNEKFVKQ